MGIIVNLTDRTVRGWDFPFDLQPLEIGYVNDVTVLFDAENEGFGPYKNRVNGSINRVTGDVEATWYYIDKKGIETHMTYALQCRPTQRMF
jgi:hypothetical protein